MQGDWRLLDVAGLREDQKVRPVGFATPRSGVVPAYETLFLGNGGEAMYKHVIDARTGRVLLRQDLVENLAGEQNAIVPQPGFNGEVAGGRRCMRSAARAVHRHDADHGDLGRRDRDAFE